MIGTGEIIVILCIILVLFGGKRLPEFAKSLGKGIREFKKACNGLDEEIEELPKQLPKSQNSEINPENQTQNRHD